MIESQAYDYLPDMASSQDELNRLFDLETDFTFESSEQAWAALLWALEIEKCAAIFEGLEDLTSICQASSGFADYFGLA